MTPIHIIGQPGSGKTSFVVELIQELKKHQLRVGSLKHSSHAHELDKPGKDSFAHRKAGASPVSMVTREMAAVYLTRTREVTPLAFLEKYYSETDIVLIEGWISGPYPKVEIWRKALNKPPLFSGISHVKALVSNDMLDPESRKQADDRKILCFRKENIPQLVNF